ncbi:hypothetical protein BHE74_00030238 [Ensete ventricosum]|nr:hypothetical protein GW17_00004675 [Ensete ventricosum]RWW62619.1 hypothetical protein BHE74_00030238 [Ensete ventricosum]RZR93014.1 hypothetical protein BHM03_00021407 [Ensete ventricosum]
MLFSSASLCKFILIVAYNLLVASNVLLLYLTRNLLMTVWLLQLSELYNGDFIFDKFDCCLSRDGCHFATGTYSNTFRVFCHDGGHTDGTRLEASKNPNRRESMIVLNKLFLFFFCFLSCNLNKLFVTGRHENSRFDSRDEIPCDLDSKLIHLAWHPTTNLIACAEKCSLYMYYAESSF